METDGRDRQDSMGAHPEAAAAIDFTGEPTDRYFLPAVEPVRLMELQRERPRFWLRRTPDVPDVLDVWLAERGDFVALMREALLSERNFTTAVAREANARARRLNTVSATLSLGATLLATLAAISVLGDALGPWFTAVTAGSAALISGLQTTFRPAVKARTSAEVAIQWTEQVAEIEDLLFFRLSEYSNDRARMRAEYKKILNRRFALMRLMRLEQDPVAPLATSAGVQADVG